MRDRDIEGIRLFWAREQKVEERLVKEEVVRMARSHIHALAREALDRGVPSRGDGSHSYRCGVCMEHMPRNVVFPPLLPGLVGLRSIKCPNHGTLVWVDPGKDGLWWTYDPTTLTWPLAEPQPVGVRTPEGDGRANPA